MYNYSKPLWDMCSVIQNPGISSMFFNAKERGEGGCVYIPAKKIMV